MSESATPETTPAEHAFQVTHYIRPAGQYASWSQDTTAEVSAVEAAAWIEAQQAAAVELGLTDAQPAQDAQAGAPVDAPAESAAPSAETAPDGGQEPSVTEPA
jgi:hypothetical protein